MDNDAQERERGITIFSKQARLDISRDTNAADTADVTRTANAADTARTWHVVMLDTPGHVDFRQRWSVPSGARLCNTCNQRN